MAGDVEIVVREAEPADAESLLPLFAELSGATPGLEAARRDLESVLAAEGNVVVVAEVGDCVVGFAYGHLIQTLIRPGCWARLASMAVDPQHWRLGIGTALVEAIEQFARDTGAESIELNSGRQREGAHRFYESLGYSTTAFSVWYANPL